jgi:hypothetical protein
MKTQTAALATTLLMIMTASIAAPMNIMSGHRLEHARSAKDHGPILNRAVQRPAVRRILAGISPGTFQTLNQAAPAAIQLHAHVYLLRGFMNVFSLGMDDLAAELRTNGVDARVFNHADGDAIVNEITENYRTGNRDPVVLIGHSLGADAAMLMAASLDQNNVPVALVIPFDAVASYPAPKNVARVINFTKRYYMLPGADFHGVLVNVDLSQDPSVDHMTIDKSERLHAQVLNYMRDVESPSNSTPRRPSSAAISESGGIDRRPLASREAQPVSVSPPD